MHCRPKIFIAVFSIALLLLANGWQGAVAQAQSPDLFNSTTLTAAVGDLQAQGSECADVPLPVSAGVSPSNCITQGTPITLDFFGFQPNEEVGFWLNAPDGSVVGTVETLELDSSGSLLGVPIETAELDLGIWFFVMQGTESGHQSIAYFKVLPAGSQGGGQSGPAPAEFCADAPAPVNANILPANCVYLGTGLTIEIFGFQPGEPVGFWFTAPDGSVAGTDEPPRINDTGAASLPLNTAGLIPGLWSLTFQGTQSNHTSVIYFKLIDPATAIPVNPNDPCLGIQPPQNATVEPSTCVTRGEQLVIDIFGFTPGEQIVQTTTAPTGETFVGADVYTTGPDGKPDIGGRLAFPTGVYEPGLYRIVFEGQASGHAAIVSFKVIVRGGTPPPEPQPQPQPGPEVDPCADAPLPQSGGVRIQGTDQPGNCVPAGTVIEMDIFGFQPNEPIGFWLNAPDGSVAGTTQTANIGPEGSAIGLPWDTSGASPGVWFWVFQGTESGHQSIIYVKILPATN